MADALPNSTTIAQHLKCRPTRNPQLDPQPQAHPQMPCIIQSTGCKSTLSSLIISTFSNSPENALPKTKKASLKPSSFRGFGCTAQPEVTLPAVIRSSADWEDRDRVNTNKIKKKKKKKQQQQQQQQQQQLQSVLMMEDSIGVQDLWCADSSAAASVDCVRPLPSSSSSSRGKIDLHKLHPRERASYNSGQRVNATEPFTSMGLDSSFENPPFGPDVFEARYYHHLRNRSPQGLAEILMCQNGLMANRRPAGPDRYQEWRLDVDHMTYEELLELGDRIGYVSTGLAEDQIGKCVRKTKLPNLNELPSQPHKSSKMEGKCSICQEEYEEEDEVGKLECGHDYHLHCIKQWLLRRNACPVCKAEASSL